MHIWIVQIRAHSAFTDTLLCFTLPVRTRMDRVDRTLRTLIPRLFRLMSHPKGAHNSEVRSP